MSKRKKYLVCESRMIFQLLMFTAGMMGAYTFVMRGGVFSNAQTANIVLMSVSLGQGNLLESLYYLIPISAYLLGAVISEVLPNPVKRINLFRWDTYLIAFEIFVLLICGFIPLTVNHHVVQVLINFICSMQYNTFRQSENVPMATTFCTNHIRQTGVWIVKYFKTKDKASGSRAWAHITMLLSFFAGGLVESAACIFLKEKAIWLAAIPLLINLALMVYADLVVEKDRLYKKPAGH